MLALLLSSLACSDEAGMTTPDASEAEAAPAAPSGPEVAASHGSFLTSEGVYRIPYANGVGIKVTRDHHDHAPAKDRIDMIGLTGGEAIVAAASGTIRAIVDRHGNYLGLGDGLAANGTSPQDDNREHSCTDDTQVAGSCSDHNNYVWIEHPNGEWTKYTHFLTRTVSGVYQWKVGDWIRAGEVLGLEGDVGAASGPHLHFEVGRPTDPAALQPFTTLGGFMVPQSGVNLVPRVCGIAGALYVTDAEHVASACQHVAPTANAGGPYEVDEGAELQLDGTGSIDPEGRPLTYVWRPAGVVSDSLSPTPTFRAPDNTVVDVSLTVYDEVEALASAPSLTSITVRNVVPQVTIGNMSTSLNEGETLTVRASFLDPGVNDAPFVAKVTCYDVGAYSLTVDGIVEMTGSTDGLSGTVTAECPMGDASRNGSLPDGTFSVTVRVSDKDNGTGSASVNVAVANVAPTLSVSGAGTVLVNGVPTIISSEAQSVAFSASVADPGSDDITLDWAWGDGTLGSASFRSASINDPLPSPNEGPRDITHPLAHTWSAPCLYTANFTATDDDGGDDTAEATVVVTGTSGRSRGAGYWLTLYRDNRSAPLGAATLDCYLAIASHMSAVFSERRGAATDVDAALVLQTNGSRGDIVQELDQQLLAVWLNFANGAFGWNTLVDTNGNRRPDTPFSDAVLAAEAVRLDPGASRKSLEAQKKRLEAINLMHGG